jgi:cytochrome P450
MTTTEESVYGATDFREIADWQDVRFVLRSKSFEQVGPDDGYPRVGLQQRIIGDSVVMLRGDEHSERRHLESVLFRRPTLLAYEQELVRPRLRRTIAELAAARGPDGAVRGDLIRISLDMLLELMLTLTGVSLEGPAQEERFRSIFGTLDSGSRVRHAVRPEAVIEEGLEAQQAFGLEFFRPAWARHEQLLAEIAAGTRGEDEAPNDLITLMLRNPRHFEGFDEAVYLREATLFVIASVGTTTRELGLAVDSIETWIEQHPEDAAKRADGTFLERAFAESLRFHQSIPSVGRVAVADATLPSGLEIGRGETVRVNLAAASAEVADGDPAAFDPYREDPTKGERYGLAFSDGRHVCIGKQLVLGDRRGESVRDGTAKTALVELYRADMRRDASRVPAMKDTITRRFDSYPVVFEAGEDDRVG